MIDVRQIDRFDGAGYSVQPSRQIAQARDGEMPQKPNDSTAIARFFDKIGGFVHQGGLVVHYRLRGKPKRPIRTIER
jgi:hypothetical protein